jgi:hypothetical protein
MIRWFLVLCGLMAIPAWGEGVNDWQNSLPPPQPGSFPPPHSFKAVYNFGWSGIQAAKAEFDFSKARGQFQLAMKTQTTGAVRALWRMDAEHTAVCSAATLRPISLKQTEFYQGETETTKTDFSDKNVRWTTIKTPSKEPPMREHKFKVPNVLDLQTGWLYARSQRMQSGDHYRFVDFPAKGGYLMDIEVLGREKLKVAAGTYDAIKCQVHLQCITKNLDLEPQKKFKRAFAWVSDDPQRLLLKMQADIFVGSVWCELQSVEGPN